MRRHALPAFSVAGLRGSLSDERGNLTLTFATFSMKSTANATFVGDLPLFASGKTCPESSTPTTTPLDIFWRDWPEKMCRSHLQGLGGRTLVMCAVPAEQSRGGPSTPNTSAGPTTRACVRCRVC